MARFPFIGPSYPSQSVSADCQRTINFYLEQIESGTGINDFVLYWTPGLLAFTTLGGGPIRGLWPGENRLFAASGTELYEVFSDGTFHDRGFIGNDGKPVQMFPNGNQLFIISAGQAWIDNGSGPVPAVFGLQQGSVTTAGTTVTWVSGDTFTSGMAGGPITINGVTYTVATSPAPEATTLTLTTSAGTQSNAVLYSAPFLWGTVNTSGTSVTWESGSQFDAPHTAGATITINGVNYTVAATPAPTATSLTLTTSAGTQTGVVFGYNALVTASSGAFLDGFFVAAQPNSKQFYISAVLDGTHWDPTDTATKEGYPDNIAAMLADHEELWLFGDEGTTEVWQDTGAPVFPFQRDAGAFIHYSCQAPYSVARFNNGVAWLGGDQQRGGPIAWWAQGFQPVRISNYAVEQKWSSYATIADAVIYVYIDAGHEFLMVSFPTANATWCYDPLLGAARGWTERGHWNGTSQDRQRQAFHAFVGIGATAPRHYVGDWQNGTIYIMSRSYYTDNGTQITRTRRSPHASNEQLHTFFGKFQVDLETGGITLNPTLSYSDDHGHTFINPRQIAVGAAGEYKARALWWMNGHSRDRVWDFTISDAAPISLLSAYYDAVPGYG